MVPWTRQDTINCYKQGWGIFDVDGGGLRIQKLDDPEAAAFDYGFEFKGTEFSSDSAALKHVYRLAENGDDLAIRALKIVQNNPYMDDNHENT